jgi:hypothetical protein
MWHWMIKGNPKPLTGMRQFNLLNTTDLTSSSSISLQKNIVERTKLNELIQAYFEKIYSAFDTDIKQTLFANANELYGELYFYSVVKLLKYLEITEEDNFLDIGSGLGKIVFQIFLTTKAKTCTGIEINNQRHNIAWKIKDKIEEQLPEMFNKNRNLTLLNEDFLKYEFNGITLIYICSTVFSYELLTAVSQKINEMKSVRKVASFRKLPNMDKFKLSKKLFLHATWDHVACYIYDRCN